MPSVSCASAAASIHIHPPVNPMSTSARTEASIFMPTSVPAVEEMRVRTR